LNFVTDAREIEEAYAWLHEAGLGPAQPLFHDVQSIDEALFLLDAHGKEAKIIAGGLDLVGLMKNRTVSPRMLINIRNIPDLDHILETPDGLEIGALALIRDIGRSPQVAARYPLLSEAAREVGSPQIRNMATLGGNLCQEVRCWYFRRSPVTGISYDCWRKGEGGRCYAIDGENENHAIIGSGECFAVCPSDMAVALLALNAKVRTLSLNGGRLIPIGGLYTNLGTVLAPDEMITGIEIPKVKASSKQRYLKLRTRKAFDFPIASVAALLTLDGESVSQARIALGGVSSIPYQASKAEKVLVGRPITGTAAEEAAEESTADARPLSQNAYKVQIVKALVRRALLGRRGEGDEGK